MTDRKANMTAPNERPLSPENRSETAYSHDEVDKTPFFRQIRSKFFKNKEPEEEPLLPIGEPPASAPPEVSYYIKFLNFIWEYVLTQRSRNYFRQHMGLFFIIMTVISILAIVLTQIFYNWIPQVWQHD